jgi:hypothetical protein
MLLPAQGHSRRLSYRQTQTSLRTFRVLDSMLLNCSIFQLAVLTLLAALPAVTLGQLARPAVEYHSLLNMRFSEDNGEFLIEGFQIVFPPMGDERAMLTVNRSSGEEVVSLPLRFESYSSSPLFGDLVPIDEPRGIKLGQSGDFVLTIKVADQVITRLPFTLKVEPDGDPYDSPKKFLREGPWRDLAYFSVPADNLSATVDFNWWMSLRELPIGMTNPQVTVHLMRGYREIASSRDCVALNSDDWQFFTSDLIQTTKFGSPHVTLGELAKRAGDYLLIVEANGKPIKSYPVEVKGGRLQRADQSRLDFEPHSDFISPRLIDTSAKPDSHNLMRDVYWVRRSAVTGTFAQPWASK